MDNAGEKHHMTRAAGVVGAATLASRVGGFVRDMVIAYFFGAGPAADAFFVAFRIPNLLRRLFAEGTLAIAFIPVFTEVLRKKGKEEAYLLARSTAGALGLCLLVVTVAGVLLAGPVVRVMAPGFVPGEGTYRLAVELTRWCFPYIFFISLVALAGGVLNSLRHFFAPAMAPLLLNISIIACAAVLGPRVDPPVLSLAVGVLVGGVTQLIMQLPYLRAKGFSLLPAWNWKNPALRRVGRLMLPAAFGAAVYQLAVFINTVLASLLPTGSVSYLYYADRVIEFPLGVFAIALATAVLPSLSRQAADDDIPAMVDTLGYGLRLTWFITLPAMIGLMVLAKPVVLLLFARGEFGSDSALATAQALVGYSAGLWAFAGVRSVVPAFYALKDTRTPVLVAAGSLIINVSLSLLLMGPLLHVGLAVATSVSSAANLAGLLWLLKRRLGRLGGRAILSSVVRMFLASLAMAILVWLVAYGPDWGEVGGIMRRGVRPLLAIVVGVAAYLGAAKFLGSPEIAELWQIWGRKARPDQAAPPPAEP